MVVSSQLLVRKCSIVALNLATKRLVVPDRLLSSSELPVDGASNGYA